MFSRKNYWLFVPFLTFWAVLGACGGDSSDGESDGMRPDGTGGPGSPSNIAQFVYSCPFNDGPGTLTMRIEAVSDSGIVWGSGPEPEIIAVIGLDNNIYFTSGFFTFSDGTTSQTFEGRDNFFQFEETLDNSQTGRFEWNGDQLNIFFPFDNTVPIVCTILSARFL